MKGGKMECEEMGCKEKEEKKEKIEENCIVTFTSKARLLSRHAY
jgi:hypothetical protein